MKVSKVSVSRKAGWPWCWVLAHSGSDLIGEVTPSMRTSSGNTTGSSSSGTGTWVPSSSERIGIGAPQ